MRVGDGGDDEFVGPGRLLELPQPGRDRGGGADELGVDAVGDQGPILVAPDVGGGFFRRGKENRPSARRMERTQRA